MASGRLANTYLSTTANTVVYTVPAAKIAVATVSIVNLGDVQTPLYLSLTESPANTPGNSEYLELKETPFVVILTLKFNFEDKKKTKSRSLHTKGSEYLNGLTTLLPL